MRHHSCQDRSISKTLTNFSKTKKCEKPALKTSFVRMLFALDPSLQRSQQTFPFDCIAFLIAGKFPFCAQRLLKRPAIFVLKVTDPHLLISEFPSSRVIGLSKPRRFNCRWYISSISAIVNVFSVRRHALGIRPEHRLFKGNPGKTAQRNPIQYQRFTGPHQSADFRQGIDLAHPNHLNTIIPVSSDL